MARKKTEAEWLAEQGYLPKFMRDFHDQKDIFKWIWRQLKPPQGVDPLQGMNWISAHIFVIDFFLWFMARHGYTLQPVRKPWPHADWDATIKDMKEQDAAIFREALDKTRRAEEEQVNERGAGKP